MTNSQIEVITSVERRRRWPRAEKERLVAASFEPGATVSGVAREAGIYASQLYGWRRQLCVRTPAAAAFAAVRIAREERSAVGLASPLAAIEVEFANGMRMRVTGSTEASTIAATIAALAKAKAV